jgi:surface carbohydrate biosynthesis protein
MTVRKIVILVDNKNRDLMVAALVSFLLKKQGIECFLEPLEAYRGVLEAYRPDMIIFNHLTGSHLVAYSKKLNKIGILTAVLPNEGIIYDKEALLFNSGKFHSGAHIDYFFCWQQEHKDALVETGFNQETELHIIGVPRFDYYFKPWSNTLGNISFEKDDKPQILFCTNFSLARFRDFPAIESDKIFAPWKDRIPAFKDYRKVIENNYKSRQKAAEYLSVLAKSQKYQIILKLHPGEEVYFYNDWWNGLDPDFQRYVTIAQDTNISSLILNCDLEISCETCTTALESWIANKPTIELVFYKDPVFYHEHVAALNVTCNDPDQIISLVDEQLANSEQAEYQEPRRAHLAHWCNAPNGESSLKMVNIISNAVRDLPPQNWDILDFADYRRGWKLRLLRKIGLPYSYPFFLGIKSLLFPEKYKLKKKVYRKTIKPGDVQTAYKQLESAVR